MYMNRPKFAREVRGLSAAMVVNVPHGDTQFRWRHWPRLCYGCNIRPIAGGGTSTSESGWRRQYENQLHSQLGREVLGRLF
jgi:hypothetical protein